MSRLIDADALIENLRSDVTGKNLIRLYNLNGFINAQPTVDAVPVKHGHWIKIGSQYSIRNMKCSICGEEVFGDVDTEKYCFNCGAKMDEVTK